MSDRGHLLVAGAEPARDVERELHGGAGEVEVRALEHAQLDRLDRLRHALPAAGLGRVALGGSVDLGGQ